MYVLIKKHLRIKIFVQSVKYLPDSLFLSIFRRALSIAVPK